MSILTNPVTLEQNCRGIDFFRSMVSGISGETFPLAFPPLFKLVVVAVRKENFCEKWRMHTRFHYSSYKKKRRYLMFLPLPMSKPG